MTPTSIGLLLFPRLTQLDLTGPFEVFAKMPGASVHLLWKSGEPVAAETGMRILPDTTLAECPPLDVLCVPGGPGVSAMMEDAEVLAFLREQAGRVRFLTSVCTGALILGAAGLLRGKRATTHWASHHLLEGLGAIPVEERIVTDGKLITGGGATAGIDFALAAIAQLVGREEAEVAQLELEYTPAPPFDAGSPRTAPATVIERVRADSAATVADRARIIAELRAAA
jgi:cyclohexyl-isocyanide hydratase